MSYFGKFVAVCSWELSSAVGSVVAPYWIFLKLRKTQRFSSSSYIEKNPKKGHNCSWTPVQNSLGKGSDLDEVKVSHSNHRRRLKQNRKGEDNLSTTSLTLITDQRAYMKL